MNRLSIAEFEAAASRTRIKETGLLISRGVLVAGLSAAEAARRHNRTRAYAHQVSKRIFDISAEIKQEAIENNLHAIYVMSHEIDLVNSFIHGIRAMSEDFK